MNSTKVADTTTNTTNVAIDYTINHNRGHIFPVVITKSSTAGADNIVEKIMDGIEPIMIDRDAEGDGDEWRIIGNNKLLAQNDKMGVCDTCSRMVSIG